MGYFKNLVIEQAEWLEEKLNSVKAEHEPEYTFDECQEMILDSVVALVTKGTPHVGIRIRHKSLLKDLWKVAQLSPEDGNRLMDISEDLYVMAMEEHKDE